MLKKILAAVGTVALSLGMVSVATLPAAAAAAPDTSVSADCSAVSVDLKHFDDDTVIQVWVDGNQVEDTTFDGNFKTDYDFAAGPDSHTYRVVVDTVDDADESDTGTVTVDGCGTTEQQETTEEPTGEQHVDVTLCHWTQAGKWNNPQVIDDDAAFNSGHLDPSKSDDHSFDIIKPFYYTDGTYFPGKNWEGGVNEPEYKDSYPFNGYTGEQIMANGCAVPEPEPEVVVPEYGHEDQKCDDDEYVAGYIWVTLNSAITFSLKDSGDNPVAIDGSGMTGPLTPGTYYLSAADADANDDYDVQEFTDTAIVIDEYGDNCGDNPIEVYPQYGHDDQTCDVDQYVEGYIWVTLNSAITFSLKDSGDNPVAIDGSGMTGPLAPGTYYLSAADADANDDYDVQEFTDTAIVIDAYGFLCGDLSTDPTVEAYVSSTPLTCEADGSFTLSDNAEFTEEHPGPAVTWTVNGGPSAAGTFPVTAAGTVIVQVEVNGPDWGWNNPEQQTEWELVFAAPTGCDLETLALTGVDDAAPGLALAGFLGLLGAALVRSGARLGRQQI